MVIKKTLPATIKAHPYSWLLGPKWNDVHTKDQMFSVVCCGAPGSGKTSAMLCLAELLDRGPNDEPRFSAERIAYNAEQFGELMSAKFFKGTAIVLDDFALYAYSADALTKEVKAISKTFQKFRHKNYIVLMTLPVYTMLAKNVRAIAQNYAETFTIDRTNEQNILKFQRLQVNAKTGDCYFHSYMQKAKRKHYLFDIDMIDSIKRRYIKLNKPSKELWNDYKKYREEKIGAFYLDIKTQLGKRKKRKAAVTFADRYNYVKGNLKAYLNTKGEVSTAKIMLNTSMVIPEGAAKLISMQLNEELKTQGVKGGYMSKKGLIV